MSAAADPPLIEASFTGSLGDFRLDAAFSVSARGVTAIVGPSGCGKTSLLRCVAGLARLPGRLVVAGETWQDEDRFLAPHRRPLGFVFQDARLFWHLSVRENLLFGHRRRRATPGVGFEEVVELLGVEPLLARPTSRLSGGERQRVAIARALLAHPRLLLMDEPLSSLDAAGKAEILPYLAKLQQTFAIPILYVSHDRAEVARLADRVLHMRDGRISAQPVGADAAEARLAALSPEQVTGLALAALRAGLEPPDPSA